MADTYAKIISIAADGIRVRPCACGITSLLLFQASSRFEVRLVHLLQYTCRLQRSISRSVGSEVKVSLVLDEWVIPSAGDPS